LQYIQIRPSGLEEWDIWPELWGWGCSTASPRFRFDDDDYLFSSIIATIIILYFIIYIYISIIIGDDEDEHEE